MKTSEHYLFHTSTPSADGIVVLNESETHHALNVLRLQTGDRIQVTDGNGSVFDCIIKGNNNHQLLTHIESYRIYKRQNAIHLMVGLPEREAFETIISECTALGVSRITPVIASHCQKPWWKYSWDKYCERFSIKMAVSMKQSLFPWLPVLDQPVTLKDSLSLCNVPVLAADPDGSPILSACQNIPCKDIICYIGPPGGFSSDELDLLVKNNAVKVKIGTPRFRTELASVVICAQLTAITQN